MKTQYTYIHDRPAIHRVDTLLQMEVRLEHGDGQKIEVEVLFSGRY